MNISAPETATLRRDTHHEPFRFLIRRDRDGKHRWYLYNASGTIVGMHSSGFPSELDAYEDVEHVRAELAIAPIIRETGPEGASEVATGHETGGGT